MKGRALPIQLLNNQSLPGEAVSGHISLGEMEDSTPLM